MQHIYVSRQQRVVRGLRSALGAGVDVIGPGAAFLGAPAVTAEDAVDDPNRFGLGPGALVDRWVDPRGGAHFDDVDRCGPTGTIEIPDPTATELETITEFPPIVEFHATGPSCSTFSLAGHLQTAEAKAREQAIEQAWYFIARHLWGAMVSSDAATLIPYNNMAGLGALGRTAAMALGRVEQALALLDRLAYSRGLIHIPYALVPDLVAKGIVIQTVGSNRLSTANGNTVVADPGYTPNGATDDPTTDLDNSVVIGTPPITIWAGEPYRRNPSVRPETNDIEIGWSIPLSWGWPGGNPPIGHVVAECMIGPCDDETPTPDPEPEPEPDPEP